MKKRTTTLSEGQAIGRGPARTPCTRDLVFLRARLDARLHRARSQVGRAGRFAILPQRSAALFVLTSGQFLDGNFFTARKPGSDPRGDVSELYESFFAHVLSFRSEHGPEVDQVSRS